MYRIIENFSRKNFYGVLFFLFIIPLSAVSQESQIQELLDRAEIEDLISSYSYALDTLDADSYAAVFTEDAILDMGEGQVFHGKEEIKSLIFGILGAAERNNTTAPVTHHVISNSTLEFVNNHRAINYSYFMTVLEGVDDGNLQIFSMGEYEDILVKTEAGWLFQSKKLLRNDNASAQ